MENYEDIHSLMESIGTDTLIQSLEAENNALFANLAYSIATESESDNSNNDEISETVDELKELKEELDKAIEAGDTQKAKALISEINNISNTSASNSKKNVNWKKVAMIGGGIIASLGAIVGATIAVKKWRDNRTKTDTPNTSELAKTVVKEIGIIDKYVSDNKSEFKEFKEKYNSDDLKHKVMFANAESRRKMNELGRKEQYSHTGDKSVSKREYIDSQRKEKSKNINDDRFEQKHIDGRKISDANRFYGNINLHDRNISTLSATKKAINRNQRKKAKIKAGKEAFGLEHLDDLEFIEVIESLGFAFDYEGDNDMNYNEDLALLQSLEAETNALFASINYSMAIESDGADNDDIADMADDLKELEAELTKAMDAGDVKKTKAILDKIERISKDSAKKSKKDINWKKVAMIGATIAASVAVTIGAGVAVKKWREKRKLLADRAKQVEQNSGASVDQVVNQIFTILDKNGKELEQTVSDFEDTKSNSIQNISKRHEELNRRLNAFNKKDAIDTEFEEVREKTKKNQDDNDAKFKQMEKELADLRK